MRQPTQVYEIISSSLVLGLIWVRKPNSVPGSDFISFVALSALGRLIMEAFRGDSTLVLGGLRLAQIIAWLLLAFSLLGIELLKSKQIAVLPAKDDDQSIQAKKLETSEKLEKRREQEASNRCK